MTYESIKENIEIINRDTNEHRVKQLELLRIITNLLLEIGSNRFETSAYSRDMVFDKLSVHVRWNKNNLLTSKE